MKKLLSILFLFCLVVPGVSNSKDSSLLPLYLPAILAAAENREEISCGDIAGCYYGNVSVSSSGYPYDLKGKMKLNVNSDCSFTTLSQYNSKSKGEMNKREGNSLTGYGSNVDDGSSFSLSCNILNSAISCNYNVSDGSVGRITSASKDTCVASSRFLTETLGGDWQFNYSVGSSSYSDTFTLEPGTLKPSPYTAGDFVMSGVNQFNSPVTAGFVTSTGGYEIYKSGNIIDEDYVFYYTNSNSIEGCHYLYSHSAGIWYSCDPLTGYRY